MFLMFCEGMHHDLNYRVLKAIVFSFHGHKAVLKATKLFIVFSFMEVIFGQKF
jgi:hypothetical protein